LGIFAAIRLASSFVSSFATVAAIRRASEATVPTVTARFSWDMTAQEKANSGA
jgi:hypothetical protein